MAKFILLYNGPATESSDMDPATAKAVMEKWGAWMQKLGPAMVDMGQPFNKRGLSVVDDGSTGTPIELNGYSIVEAADIKAAAALCEGHPFLSDGTGNFSVDVYEMLPVPGM